MSETKSSRITYYICSAITTCVVVMSLATCTINNDNLMYKLRMEKVEQLKAGDSKSLDQIFEETFGGSR